MIALRRHIEENLLRGAEVGPSTLTLACVCIGANIGYHDKQGLSVNITEMNLVRKGRVAAYTTDESKWSQGIVKYLMASVMVESDGPTCVFQLT